MIFTPDLECPSCHRPEHEHLRQCPRDKDHPILCPICDGPRHHHDVTVEQSRRACLWTQYLRDKPEASWQDFEEWVKIYGDKQLAGYVDAERMIRHQKREQK